jgi:hypothetical protein
LQGERFTLNAPLWARSSEAPCEPGSSSIRQELLG